MMVIRSNKRQIHENSRQPSPRRASQPAADDEPRRTEKSNSDEPRVVGGSEKKRKVVGEHGRGDRRESGI